MRRELPTFPENRKILEGGEDFYLYWASDAVASCRTGGRRGVRAVRLAVMSTLSGAVTDHELLSIAVDPPVLPADVEAQALATMRGKALTITDARRLLLAACAVAIERELQRVVWPGDGGGARTSTAIVIVRDHGFGVPFCSLYPETLSQSITSLRRWDDEAWVTLSPSAPYRTLPGARILVGRAGQYEIVSSLTAPTSAPPNAIEAVARLWAYRETLKPGDLTEVTGEQQVLAGGMMKSGAAEALRAEKWRVSL